MEIRQKIKDLKKQILRIEYGPIDEQDRSTIDLVEEISSRLSLNSPIDELEVEVIDDIREEAYSMTDRSEMPSNYLCRGSIGTRFYEPDGKVASLYLADFIHSRQHHNPWLWGWDFQKKDTYDENKQIWDKKIPDHDSIPLDKELVVKLVVGEETYIRKIKADEK